MRVGSLQVVRDIIDVRDGVDGILRIAVKGNSGEIYNVCSGSERTVRSLLERLLELSGVQAEIVNDPARFRPADQPRVCGSHEKLSQHTGWQPAVPIDETLLNLYRYWENEIGK